MTLAALWSASLEVLSAPARALCRMAAYFPPRLILEEVWVAGGAGVSEWADPDLRDLLAGASTRRQRVGRLVAELARQHLVTRFTVTGMELCASPQAWGDDGGDATAQFPAFSMHRLVQEVVRQEAGKSTAGDGRMAALSASIAMGTRHVGDTSAGGEGIDTVIRTPLLGLCAGWHAASVLQHAERRLLETAPEPGALLSGEHGAACSHTLPRSRPTQTHWHNQRRPRQRTPEAHVCTAPLQPVAAPVL